MKGIFDMGFNLEEMAGQFGLDAETIKKAAESGDLSSAMDSISGVLAGNRHGCSKKYAS